MPVIVLADMGLNESKEVPKARPGKGIAQDVNVQKGLDALETLAEEMSNKHTYSLVVIVRDFGGYDICRMAINRIAVHATHIKGPNELPFLVYVADKKRWGKADVADSAHNMAVLLISAMGDGRIVPRACSAPNSDDDGPLPNDSIPRCLNGEESDSVFALVALHYQMATLAAIAVRRTTALAFAYEMRYLMNSATYTTLGMLIQCYGTQNSEDVFHGAVVCPIRELERSSFEELDYYRMLSVRNNMGRTVIHLLAIYADGYDTSVQGNFLSEMLTHCPTTAVIQDDSGMTPLMHCAKMRNHHMARVIREFLAPGDYAQKDANGRNAVDYAHEDTNISSESLALYSAPVE